MYRAVPSPRQQPQASLCPWTSPPEPYNTLAVRSWRAFARELGDSQHPEEGASPSCVPAASTLLQETFLESLTIQREPPSRGCDHHPSGERGRNPVSMSTPEAFQGCSPKWLPQKQQKKTQPSTQSSEARAGEGGTWSDLVSDQGSLRVRNWLLPLPSTPHLLGLGRLRDVPLWAPDSHGLGFPAPAHMTGVTTKWGIGGEWARPPPTQGLEKEDHPVAPSAGGPEPHGEDRALVLESGRPGSRPRSAP